MAFLTCTDLDTDADGICNSFEITGCQDPLACNFNALATDAGSCILPIEYYNCDGTCIHDNDGDDVCDELGVLVYQEFWMTGDNNGRWAGY